MQRRSGNLFQFAIVSGFACLGAQDLSAQSQSAALGIALSCERRADSIEFTITLRNADSADTSVFIGAILGNGRKYLAYELAVEVRGANGTTEYHYSDPSVPAIAGRLDPWVIGLPASSSFTIVRGGDYFWAAGTPLSQIEEPFEVRARLPAREIPGDFAIPHFQAFVGELLSEWISVPNGCRPAA